jgi:hypothetical protein
MTHFPAFVAIAAVLVGGLCARFESPSVCTIDSQAWGVDGGVPPEVLVDYDTFSAPRVRSVTVNRDTMTIELTSWHSVATTVELRESSGAQWVALDPRTELGVTMVASYPESRRFVIRHATAGCVDPRGGRAGCREVGPMATLLTSITCPP